MRRGRWRCRSARGEAGHSGSRGGARASLQSCPARQPGSSEGRGFSSPHDWHFGADDSLSRGLSCLWSDVQWHPWPLLHANNPYAQAVTIKNGSRAGQIPVGYITSSRNTALKRTRLMRPLVKTGYSPHGLSENYPPV